MRRTGFLLTIAATFIGAVFAYAQDRRGPGTQTGGASAQTIDYERDVRPILSQ